MLRNSKPKKMKSVELTVIPLCAKWCFLLQNKLNINLLHHKWQVVFCTPQFKRLLHLIHFYSNAFLFSLFSSSTRIIVELHFSINFIWISRHFLPLYFSTTFRALPAYKKYKAISRQRAKDSSPRIVVSLSISRRAKQFFARSRLGVWRYMLAITIDTSCNWYYRHLGNDIWVFLSSLNEYNWRLCLQLSTPCFAHTYGVKTLPMGILMYDLYPRTFAELCFFL